MSNAITTAAAKTFLRSLRDEREYIEELIDHVEEARVFAEAVGSALGKMGGDSSESGDSKMAEGVSKLIAAREKLSVHADEYALRSARALEIIGKMPDLFERRVLLLYYFPKENREDVSQAEEKIFRTWEEVALKLHCDVKTAQRRHGKALFAFAEFFNTENCP